MLPRLSCLILLATLSNTGMAAEYWKCVQKNGKVTYTDMPCPGASKQQATPVKNEVRYVENYAHPTTYMDDIKNFYHRFFPASTSAQSAPSTVAAPAPSKTNHDCINRNRTHHFDQPHSNSKMAFSSAEGC